MSWLSSKAPSALLCNSQPSHLFVTQYQYPAQTSATESGWHEPWHCQHLDAYESLQDNATCAVILCTVQGTTQSISRNHHQCSGSTSFKGPMVEASCSPWLQSCNCQCQCQSHCHRPRRANKGYHFVQHGHGFNTRLTVPQLFGHHHPMVPQHLRLNYRSNPELRCWALAAPAASLRSRQGSHQAAHFTRQSRRRRQAGHAAGKLLESGQRSLISARPRCGPSQSWSDILPALLHIRVLGREWSASSNAWPTLTMPFAATSESQTTLTMD